MSFASVAAAQTPADASGTAWQPEVALMRGHAAQVGSWELGAHWSAFVQRISETGPRGASQFGSVNWLMATGQRPAAGGRLMLRGMFSADSWTIAGCGYPNLLASGELCDDEPIYDLQHPYELFMEVAARYDRPLGNALTLQLYAAIAGEPAIGPVAYLHRASASANPVSPISHHWLDATHISFGVLTAGIYAKAWKAEASGISCAPRRSRSAVASRRWRALRRRSHDGISRLSSSEHEWRRVGDDRGVGQERRGGRPHRCAARGVELHAERSRRMVWERSAHHPPSRLSSDERCNSGVRLDLGGR